MWKFWASGVVMVGSLLGAASARADDTMSMLAQSGDWIAMAHRAVITAAPDVCVAAIVSGAVAFRADADSVEIRVMDQSWSLPAGVQGDILVAVGDWKKTLSVDSNTDTMVGATLDPDDVQGLFAAMDKASGMTVAVGKGKPKTVSLAGSTKVTNAFRTCAHISGNAASGGANPFQ